MNNDIVYILKNGITDDELIYSVRSVCKNFEFNQIWFAGGIPEHVSADHSLYIPQKGKNKWNKVTNTIKEICKNKDITEDFWLFNDDFFIMRPLTTSLPPLIDGTIENRIRILNKKYPITMSEYAKQLWMTNKLLKDHNCDTLNYALHVPMLINKKKALDTIWRFPDSLMFRSLYGNHHQIGGTVTGDVKITELDIEPSEDVYLLSTSDESFKRGRVGKFIRDKFPEKCRYET